MTWTLLIMLSVGYPAPRAAFAHIDGYATLEECGAAAAKVGLESVTTRCIPSRALQVFSVQPGAAPSQPNGLVPR